MSNGLELDFIILHYFLKDKIFAHEIVKEITVEYLDPKVQIFYATLSRHFVDPTIRQVISLTALTDYCSRHKLDEQIPKFKIIHDKALNLRLSGEHPKPEDLRYYIKLMKQRRMVQIARENVSRLNELLEDSTPNSEELGKAIQHTVGQVNSVNRLQVFDEGTLGQDIDNMMAEYDAIGRDQFGFRGVTVGYPSFDVKTNGLHKGELTILCGMEGSGKSLLMMNMAVNAWLGTNKPGVKEMAQNGHNVLYFSLEMPRSNKGEFTQGSYFNKRVLSCVSELDLKQIQNAALSQTDKNKLSQVADFIKGYEENHYKFHVVDIPRGATVADIESKFIEINANYPIDLVVVDYLGIMATTSDVPDHEAQGHISEELHEFARTYNIPVLTAAQLNRPSGSKGQSLDNQSYNNTRLARSARIGQNANNVLMIVTRDDEHLLKDMIIHITKMRDGQKGTLYLTKNFECMRIYDGTPLGSSDAEMSLFEDLGIGKNNG